jgi:hypothetical protein
VEVSDLIVKGGEVKKMVNLISIEVVNTINFIYDYIVKCLNHWLFTCPYRIQCKFTYVFEIDILPENLYDCKKIQICPCMLWS